MITFTPYIIPGNRHKDGTYVVYIRITYAGKARRWPTTLVCGPADLTRSLNIKNPTILNKSGEIIAQMREAVSELNLFDLEGRDVDWVVRHIKESLSRESFALDYFVWADRYILTKSESTRRSYTCALNAFERFLGCRTIDINAITRQMLLEFVEAVDATKKMHYNVGTGITEEIDSEKQPRGASSRYISKLENIYNAAKDKYNDEDDGRILIPRSPFSKIEKSFPASVGQNSLGQEVMQRIISYQTDSPLMRTALDIFVVSFALMGANMADLYNAECRQCVHNQWLYNRQKTATRRADKAEMRVSIPDCIIPALNRLKSGKKWWLGGLHKFASNKDNATRRTNRFLKQWAEQNGIEPFTFYAARHTWATLARQQGVDKSTIDDCLGHKGDYQVADIYAERAWGLMDEANRKVLDMFEW